MPFHHQSAFIKQLFGKFYCTLHVPKKGALPTAPQPVLAVDDDALLETLLSRAVRDLKRLLIVLVPSCSRRKCLQEPGFVQQLYRLFVNRPGSQRLLGPPHPLWLADIRCMSNAPPQSTSPESSSPRPWGTICTLWPSPRAPFPSWPWQPQLLTDLCRNAVPEW
ncbi:hypothetical protein V1522DRAFT_460963 [Lipomyces starkeyi]